MSLLAGQASGLVFLAAKSSGIGHAIDTINEWILALANSPWVLVAVLLVAWIDGFFPPVPSETLVVAAAVVFVAAHRWSAVLVLPLVAAAGAMAGDLTAYSLGRFFKAGNWRLFRQGKGETAVAWARRSFAKAGAVLIIVARYIPIGRVAVNLTAGSIRFPLRRFVIFDAVAGVTWGIYSTAFGALAGRATRDNPLFSVVIGVTLSVLVGLLVQRIINRRLGGSFAKSSKTASG